MTDPISNKNQSLSGPCWSQLVGGGPLVAVANHNGHLIRPEAADLIVLPASDRLREEDPYTGDWTTIAPTRMVASYSRFEFDLNRSRETAVYLAPADAWGLDVWKKPPDPDFITRSLSQYDAYYAELFSVFQRKARQYPAFIVFDLHSYNHRRQGPGSAADDPQTNPEINIGTRTLRRDKWSALIDRFINDLQQFDFLGRHLDVRENVKFGGGHMARWMHAEFPDLVCVLAIEVKKFFMDEWTGELDKTQHNAILDALRSTIPGLLTELSKLGVATLKV